MKHSVSRRAVLGTGAATLTFVGTGVRAADPEIQSNVDVSTLEEFRRTPLGLYLTPVEAHTALNKNPEILFVDVRDPIEVTFVGHSEGVDKIIPLRTATYDVDPKTGQYRMEANPEFVSDVDALTAEYGRSKADPIFVSCRSGGRSAIAAGMLFAAGYTNVWSLIEGFEGDANADGNRSLNGWRNAGLPWSYKLKPGVAWEG